MLKFYPALDADTRGPGPDWWTIPLPTVKLPSIIPPGRRFCVTCRSDAGIEVFWFFPDGGAADGPALTDREFRPVEPPPAVREHVERVYGKPSADGL